MTDSRKSSRQDVTVRLLKALSSFVHGSRSAFLVLDEDDEPDSIFTLDDERNKP